MLIVNLNHKLEEDCENEGLDLELSAVSNLQSYDTIASSLSAPPFVVITVRGTNLIQTLEITGAA